MVGGDGEREARERTGGGAEGRGQEDEEEEAVIQVVRTDGQEEGLTEIPRSRRKRCSPFYMLSQFSSSHIQRRVLAPLLRSCDHSAAGSLYAQGRPGRHRLNP